VCDGSIAHHRRIASARGPAAFLVIQKQIEVSGLREERRLREAGRFRLINSQRVFQEIAGAPDRTVWEPVRKQLFS